MNFLDLPSRAKLLIFEYLANEAKSLATVNGEMAVLASIAYTKKWINSHRSRHWINLPPATNHLEFKKFENCTPVLRVDRRDPSIISRLGFRRRGLAPQFLPRGHYSLEEYNEALSQTILNPVDEQVPWGTMVCTWNFSTYQKKQYRDAVAWEPAAPEDNECNTCEKGNVWIYFAYADEGVVNSNSFDERTLLGILPTNIVGALKISHGNILPNKYWLNPNCTIANSDSELYSNLRDFILNKMAAKMITGLNNKIKDSNNNNSKPLSPEINNDHHIFFKTKKRKYVQILNDSENTHNTLSS